MMNPDKITKRLRARERIILARMRRWGYTVETEVLAEKKPQPESSAPDQAQPTDTTVTSVPETDTTVPDTESSETATTPTETEAPPSETAPPPPSDTSTTTT